MTSPTDLPELAGLPLFSPTTPTPPAASRPASPAAPPSAAGATSLLARRRAARSAAGHLSMAPSVDWSLVRALRGSAAKELAEALGDRPGVDQAETRALGEQIVDDLVRAHVSAAAVAGQPADRALATALRTAVLDSLFGLGRLQPLVDNPDLTDIELYGDTTILIWADGRVTEGPTVADTDEELIEELAFLASQQRRQRTFSPASPLLDLRLDVGARLAAHAWVSRRPCAVIRLHRLQMATLADLVARGMLPPDLHTFLARALRVKLTFVVAGAQGSGKTTLLRAMCAEFDPLESVTTIETEFELHLDEMPERHRRVHALEMRPGSGERLADGSMAGAVNLDDLARLGWRLNTERIILGEVRGPEIMEMFNIMGGGAGGLCTVHASDARTAINRMVTLALGAGTTAQYARAQVADLIDLVVHVAVATDDTGRKHRWVSEVLYLEANGDGGLATTVVWKAGEDRVARLVHMPPALVEALDWRG
ncbi:MAG TPA: ATPase, T2SS/T4P/T4SS family [Candidatus Limnocylindrales bacterium]|nr:ATPase, T2SS/T4P/T4SS family [Candidatus Limnocylindrales bacterium]